MRRRANPHRADALPSPRARQLNFMVISTLEKRVAELEAQVLQNSKAAVKDALEGRVKSLEEHVHKVARKSVDEQVSRIDEKLGEKNKEQQSMLMEKMQTIASKAAEKGVKSVERNLYVKVSDANQEHFERVASLTGGWKKPFVILCGIPLTCLLARPFEIAAGIITARP